MTKTNELIDAIYALTVDIGDYDQFMQSWEEVSASWTEQLPDDQTPRSDREQRALLEHFRRAEQIFARIGRQQEPTDDLTGLLETKAHPALVVDAQGQIVATNPAMDAQFPDLARGGNLHAQLNALVKAGREGQAIDIDALVGKQASQLVLIYGEPCLLVSGPLPDRRHTLVDFSQASWQDALERDLRTLFDLSMSEIAICHLLYEGYEVKEIATLRSRAEDTVRKQIKSIQAKTRCAKQPDLMRLLTGMLVLGQLGREEAGADAGLINRDSITLPDGRVLYFFHLMPPTGFADQTVIICHGIGSSPIFPAAYFDLLLQAGIGIIGVSRAGYGRSSPLEEGAHPARQFGQDLQVLLDRLDVTEVSLVSVQSGAMFAFGALQALGRRVLRAVCIAPLVPLSTPALIAGLPLNLRLLARTKKFFPAFFPLLIQSVLARVDAGDVSGLYESLYKGVPSDLRVLSDESSQRHMDRWMRFCGAQGTAAYISDADYVLSDWTDLIGDQHCPMLFLRGEDDHVVSEQAIKAFIAPHAQITLEQFPDLGQLMLLAVPDKLAQRTLAFLQTGE